MLSDAYAIIAPAACMLSSSLFLTKYTGVDSEQEICPLSLSQRFEFMSLFPRMRGMGYKS